MNESKIMLTKKQKQILDFVELYIAKNDYAPTYQEIQRYFKLSSVATVHQHIQTLVAKNCLKRIKNQPRSIELMERAKWFDLVDDKILNRERKVINRRAKEKIRGGTKDQKKTILIKEDKAIKSFVNKIICGDSEKVLKKMPNDSIDIIITSPPYNFGLNYKNDKKDDAVVWSQYFKKLFSIWQQCVRVLKPGGRLCLNVQPLFSDYVPTHHIMSKQLLELGLLWKGEILWEKNNYNCKYTAWGSWKSPSMPYLKYTWEFIEIFCKDTHKKTGDANDIDITGDEFKKWVYAKWNIAPERNMKQYQHPAMFPEELAYRLIRLFSYKDDIVLDPFNGVGTTTAVAKKINRRFIGIDIANDYCKAAQQRLNEVLL